MSEMIDKVGAVVGERFIRLSHWKYQMGICTANHSILLSFSFSVFLLTIWLTTVYKGFLIPWVLIVASCSFLQITDIFFFIYNMINYIIVKILTKILILSGEMFFCFFLCLLDSLFPNTKTNWRKQPLAPSYYWNPTFVLWKYSLFDSFQKCPSIVS